MIVKATLGMIVMVSCIATFANLLSNGDFEQQENNLPAGWDCTGPNQHTISSDQSRKKTGNWSLRIAHDNPDHFSVALQKVTVLPNTNYIIRGFAKAEKINGIGGGPRVFVFADGCGTLADIRIKSDVGWQPFEAKFNSGKQEQILFDCYLHKASGAVWFDSLTLLPEGESKAAGVIETPAPIWKFDRENDLQGWTLISYDHIKVKNGSLSATAICDYGKAWPFINSPPLQLDTSKFNTLEIVAKSDKSGGGTLFFKKSDGGEFKAPIYIIGDNQWHTYEVSLPPGIISQIKLNIINENQAKNSVSEIRLSYQTPAGAGVVLQNPSFEQNSTDNNIPFWQVNTNGSAKFEISKKNASNGAKSIVLTGNGTIELSPSDIFFDFLEETDAYIFTFDYLTAKSAKGRVTFIQYDSFEKIIQTDVLDLTIQETAQFNAYISNGIHFNNRMMKLGLKFQIEVNENNRIILDNFNLKKVASNQENNLWLGEWIGQNKADTAAGTSFFRKTFELFDKVDQSQMAITADTEITNIYVNGKLLKRTPYFNAYWMVDLLDLKPYLQPGKNVLAIETKNIDGIGALLVESAIFTNQGKRIIIKSDDSFKISHKSYEHWEQIQYDDQNWGHANVLAKVASGAWGNIKHPSLVSDKIEITKFNCPSKIVVGKEVTLKVGVIPWNENADIKIFGSSNQLKFCLFEQQFKNLKVNEETTIELKINIPKFMASLPNTKIAIDSNNSKIIVANVNVKLEKEVVLLNESPNPTASKVKLMVENQVPILKINGRNTELTHHWTGQTSLLTEEGLGNCRKNNLHLYLGTLTAGWGWMGENKFDFSGLDKFCYKLLEIDPEAKIILWLGVDSFHNTEMRSWNELYPNELVQDENGNQKFTLHFQPNSSVPSWASKIWLKDQKNNLRQIVRHVQNSPYASSVIGYQPVSGMGVEWVYWGGHDGGGGPGKYQFDYSKPFKDGFQKWVEEKYRNIDSLNSIYHDTWSDFAAIKLPTTHEREKDDYFSFIDPNKNQRLIDFREYFSYLTSDVIMELAKVVKEESRGNALFGTFYGYIVNTPVPSWAENGHFALTRILNSPNIDYITSLIRYENRLAGQEAGFMVPESSFLLHNKVAVAQLDVRTHRTPPESADAGFGRCKNLKESIAVIKRDFSNCLVSGVAFEYGYFGAMWETGDRRLMEVIAKCRDIEKMMQTISHKKMDPDTSIAVIIDDISTYYTIQASELHQQLVTMQLPKFTHSGTGIDTFLLGDLPLIKNYSVYLFLNTFNITQEQEKFINSELKKDNKTLFWVYAPGIINNRRINTKRVSEITGINLKVVESKVSPSVTVVNFKDKITQYMPSQIQYASEGMIGPFFMPLDGKVLGVATGTQHPALVVKRFPLWTSVYSSFPGMSAELIRGIAQSGKVHIANYNGLDTTYLSDKLLAIHTASAGTRKLYAPPQYKKNATELFTGQKYLIKDGSFEVHMDSKSTYLFLLE